MCSGGVSVGLAVARTVPRRPRVTSGGAAVSPKPRKSVAASLAQSRDARRRTPAETTAPAAWDRRGFMGFVAASRARTSTAGPVGPVNRPENAHSARSPIQCVLQRRVGTAENLSGARRMAIVTSRNSTGAALLRRHTASRVHGARPRTCASWTSNGRRASLHQANHPSNVSSDRRRESSLRRVRHDVWIRRY